MNFRWGHLVDGEALVYVNFLGVISRSSLTVELVVAEFEESREQEQKGGFRVTFDFAVELNCGGAILSSAVDAAMPLRNCLGEELKRVESFYCLYLLL